MNIYFELIDDPRSYPEDSAGENGNYMNICCSCDKDFVGNKHRMICKTCQKENKEKWDSLTEEEQTSVMIKNCEAIQKIFNK